MYMLPSEHINNIKHGEKTEKKHTAEKQRVFGVVRKP